MLLGQATPQATGRYAERLAAPGFYRPAQGLQVSSLGIGSYLGEINEATDSSYTEAMIAAVRGGINVIDTSLNYRHQHSERNIGVAVIMLRDRNIADRDEIVVCTKAGFLVPDAIPATVLRDEDVVGGMHSMAPAFLSHQLERSRENLNLETIDVFYLHNPETQLSFVSRDEFDRRIATAFEHLENLVRDRKIQWYGAATWDGYRKAGRLSLTRFIEIATSIAGGQHHFRFIQLPFNLAMTEGLTGKFDDVDGRPASVLDTAQTHGMTVVASASILQSRLAKGLPEEIAARFSGLTTDAQRAIQFTRSTPGITAALVGMSNPAHVEENLAVRAAPPLTVSEYTTLFGSAA